MQIITGDHISKAVDYSFGDHFSLWDTTLPGAFTKMANATNTEFLAKAKEFEGKVMTLYIDNLRLYPRYVKTDTEYDTQFVKFLMDTNNLLALCSLLPGNGFVIYTGQEDTPIDENIVLPINVFHIYGVNAVYNNERITPFPFGLQRQMNPDDKRLEIMLENVLYGPSVYNIPNRLLYLNMGIGRNPEREVFKDFKTNEWVTTRFDDQSKFYPYSRYQNFLDELRDHKFVACPPGHGMDTHRIWETLYMRRVPIVKRHPYFEKLLEGFPVLWVNNWYDVTHALLENSEPIYQEALKMDLGRLDLEKIMTTNKEKYAHQ
jgi:hypothetical protein